MQIDLQTLLILGGLAVTIVVMLVAINAGARARAEQAARLQQMGDIAQSLAQAQTTLSGRMEQAQSDTNQRLDALSKRLGDGLTEQTEKTAQTLKVLHERLAVIDHAQKNITDLSQQMIGLQDILSNKQTRGAFGEIQLNDIVGKALPSDSYTLQAQLSNNRRADCLIHLPNPPGPIVIDAKFPLEAYEALRAAGSPQAMTEAQRAMRTAVRHHIRAISEKYIIDGETADGALMFLPSEAVYAELHANFPELVREGFAARVWIVSPTTCMATLNTMRAILKDARMREQAGAIRKMLAQLHRDVEIVLERAGKLETHFDQARRDVEGITTAAERAGKRAARLDNFDFEEVDATAPVPALQPQGE